MMTFRLLLNLSQPLQFICVNVLKVLSSVKLWIFILWNVQRPRTQSNRLWKRNLLRSNMIVDESLYYLQYSIIMTKYNITGNPLVVLSIKWSYPWHFFCLSTTKELLLGWLKGNIRRKWWATNFDINKLKTTDMKCLWGYSLSLRSCIIFTSRAV